MSDCTDKELGQMLHDYELGLLSEDEARRFELHLYKCEYCDAQVREFMDLSRIMIHDSDANRLLERMSDEEEKGDVAGKKLWTPFTKLLIAAAIVLVLAVPVYRFWLQPEHATVAQTLELLPTRTTGSDVIYLEKGGDVQIVFYAADDERESADIVVAEFEGDTVVARSDFSDFNEQGLGTLTLPVSEFSEGHYVLIIEPNAEDSPAKETRYMFRVK